MIYTVYQHRNLKNGKSYIGMTSLEPKERWNSGWGYKNQPKIWSDIQNSDWNKDWEHNIIGKFKDKQEALNVEEMFIRLFDSTNEGYNTSTYGSGNYEITEEQKRKISESKGVNGILQFSKDGELIAEYSSIHEAERRVGCDKSIICKCCKGKRKSVGGYIWKYKE